MHGFGKSAHQLAAAALAGLALTLAGCNSQADEQSAGSSTPGLSASTLAGNNADIDAAAPLISQPPSWYVSSTDRFQRVRTVPGQAQVSPGGKKLLSAESGPVSEEGAATATLNMTYRVFDVASGDTVLTVTANELCRAAAAGANAALDVRVTDAGWLFFRAGDGEWQRYFPNTQRAKPALDGFHLKLLSRNLAFAIGTAMDAPNPLLLMDLKAAFTGGMVRVEPLPAQADGTPLPIATVGDTGVVALSDHSFRLRDGSILAPLPGQQPWDGGRFRCSAVEGGYRLSTLNEPAVESNLPEQTQRWWILDNRMLVFDGKTLRAVDRTFPRGFRVLPLVLAEAPAAQDTTAVPAGIEPAAREIISLAVTSEDVVVLLEQNATGQVQSAVYRWALLR